MGYVIYFCISVAHHIFSQPTSVSSPLRVLSFGLHSEKASSCPGRTACCGQVAWPLCSQPFLHGYCNCRCSVRASTSQKPQNASSCVFRAVGCQLLMGFWMCCACFSLKLGDGPAFMPVLGTPFLDEQGLTLREEPGHGSALLCLSLLPPTHGPQ